MSAALPLPASQPLSFATVDFAQRYAVPPPCSRPVAGPVFGYRSVSPQGRQALVSEHGTAASGGRSGASPSPVRRYLSPARAQLGTVVFRSFSPTRQSVSPQRFPPVASRGIVFPGAAVSPVSQFAQVQADDRHRRSCLSPSAPRRASPLGIRPSGGGMMPTVVSSSQMLHSLQASMPQSMPRVLPPAEQLPSAGPPQPFNEGEVTMIGRLRLRMMKAIGEGAYARVFAGRTEGYLEGVEVAVKEMRCGQGAGILPDASLQRARFEVKVMQLMSDHSLSQKGRREEIHVPRLLDYQFWDLAPAEPGAFLCRVAMTRQRGQALVSWLHDRAGKLPSPQRPPAEPASYSISFLHAASAAREMLVQLAPTFAKLNGSIAIHRDVNARNILVFSPSDSDSYQLSPGSAPCDSSSLEFTLLDFGSSIDVQDWTSDGGEGSWVVENPTGDARYWGPASWLRFLHGAESLAQEEAMKRQYARRLDVFALAICSLELIAKLHTEELPKTDILSCSQDSQADLVAGIARLQSSWANYWELAIGSFGKLADYSQLVCMGEQMQSNEVWQELLKRDIPILLRGRLHELCDDLLSLANLCRRNCQRGPLRSWDEATEGDAWAEIGEALEAIRDMAHEDSSLECKDLSVRLCRRELPNTSPALVFNRSVGVLPPDSTTHRSLAEMANLAFSTSSATSMTWLPDAGLALRATSPIQSPQSSKYCPRYVVGGETHHACRDSASPPPRATVSLEARRLEELATVHTPPVALQSGDHPGGDMVRSTMPGRPASLAAASSSGSGIEFSTRGEPTGNSSTAGRPLAAPPPVAVGSLPAAASGPITPRGRVVLPQRSASPNFVSRFIPSSPSNSHSPTAWNSSCRSPPPGPAATGRQSVPGVYLQGSPVAGEQDQQAMRVLSQVESEVRQLKQWYSDAIHAMRQPHTGTELKESWPFLPSTGCVHSSHGELGT
eukprot:TRINITY_DN31997_c0_g1_i1.p1 TRINITY_DN31997_c0_g1~~TRINITY_DN31997_c0_g1_i1.p1  ORF type:complete len:962 (-),score=135.48 TRINITY_DN31997_c0_g1_i1:177-3035(-)